MTARVRTGVTAWADRSLLATGWYPAWVRSPADRLRYYASQFPVVENDAGYWAVPEVERARAWAGTAPPGFVMNMKAHALMTGHYTDPRRLPRDIRAALSGDLADKPHVYPRDVGPDLVREIGQRFRAALEPLAQAGVLGLVLFQFPVWFPRSHRNRAHLAGLRRELEPYRVAVEFRNTTWMSPESAGETLALLAGENLVYTCVDEPQGFASSVPPVAAATSDLALVRMHGRNAARWQSGARSAAERFSYLYRLDQLGEWVPKIQDLARRTREVHVLMNNCHADFAVRNARQMADLLAGAQPGAPGRPTAPPG